jgi:hypothetical protein
MIFFFRLFLFIIHEVSALFETTFFRGKNKIVLLVLVILLIFLGKINEVL